MPRLPLRPLLAVAPAVRMITGSSRRYMNGVLRRYGADVADPLFLSPTAYYDPGPDCLLTIEDGVVVSNDVKLLTHDFSMANVARELGHIAVEDSMLSRRRITLKRNAFIGMGTIIMPGITIGVGSVVGAGSVVTRDVPDGTVVAGNPARVLCSTEDFWTRRKDDYRFLVA